MHELKKILILVLLLLPLSALADDEAFTVRNVEISHSGEDAATSKAKAIEAGEAQAFKVLLKNLGVAENQAGTFTAAQIAAMVASYQPQNEKSTPQSYSAVLNVSFDPALVKAVLKKANLSFHEDGSQPLLLIPVLYQNGKTLLWEPENSWRAALQKAMEQNHSAILIMPIGDNEDRGIVAAKDIESANSQAFSQLAAKYGVKDILLTEAWSDGKELTVSATTIKNNVKQKQQSFKFMKPEHTLDSGDLFKTAALAVIDSVEKERSAKVEKPEVLVTLPMISAKAEFSNIGGWVAMKDKLQKMDFVRKTEVKELSGNSARLDIYYQGDVKNLPAMFGNYGIRLSNDGGMWVLKDAGKAEAPAAKSSADSSLKKIEAAP